MGISDDVRKQTETILDAVWSTRDGKVVPHTADVALANGAVEIDAAYLYADLAGSTRLQKEYIQTFAAKAIRMYLAGASRIIRHFGGNIKSFDGDRVMGVFVGDAKCDAAAKAAFMINWLVQEVINPIVKERHEKNGTRVWVAQHGVGIDVGTSFVARAGVRNASGERTHNDLIFTGRAPNVAAKLSALRGAQSGSVIITKDVFDQLSEAQKTYQKSSTRVWSDVSTESVGPYSLTLYRTSYWRHP